MGNLLVPIFLYFMNVGTIVLICIMLFKIGVMAVIFVQLLEYLRAINTALYRTKQSYVNPKHHYSMRRVIILYLSVEILLALFIALLIAKVYA